MAKDTSILDTMSNHLTKSNACVQQLEKSNRLLHADMVAKDAELESHRERIRNLYKRKRESEEEEAFETHLPGNRYPELEESDWLSRVKRLCFNLL